MILADAGEVMWYTAESRGVSLGLGRPLRRLHDLVDCVCVTIFTANRCWAPVYPPNFRRKGRNVGGAWWKW